MFHKAQIKKGLVEDVKAIRFYPIKETEPLEKKKKKLSSFELWGS